MSITRAVAVFHDAAGTFEHHSIFWVNCDLPFAPDHFKFMHIAFGMDDIDEVMLGANLMADKGWKNEHELVGRHFAPPDFVGDLLLLRHPGHAGEAEYHADTDYLDDNWVPRAWDFRFGSLLWANNAPPIFRGPDIAWDMQFDADRRSFRTYRKAVPGKRAVEGALADQRR
jgi:hypothetical protein